MEQHVSNHRTAIDNIRDCATHIGNAVPNNLQRVEFLLDYITSQDNALHAAMGNIYTDTNGLRSGFEGTLSHLIEVDPYRRSTKSNPTKPDPVKFSEVTFARHSKTGVDLCWHTRQEFRDISSEQKDELTSWKGSNEDKATIKKQKISNINKRRSEPDNSKKGTWRNFFKKAVKTKSGILHVMSMVIEEETRKLLPHCISSATPSTNP